MRPRFYRESQRLPRVEELRYTGHGRANLSYISLQNVATRLHEKQKNVLGCDGGATLRAGPLGSIR